MIRDLLDDGKDMERGEAADREPSDGRHGYTVQRQQQGQWLLTNTSPSDGRRGYTVQQWWLVAVAVDE